MDTQSVDTGWGTYATMSMGFPVGDWSALTNESPSGDTNCGPKMFSTYIG